MLSAPAQARASLGEKAKVSRKRARLLSRLLALLVVGLLGLLLVPWLGPARKLELYAQAPLDGETLRARVLGATGGRPFFLVDKGELAERLMAVPAVRKAEVNLVFPGIVRINVWPRDAVALALYDTEGSSKLMLIDAEGVVFGLDVDASGSRLPVLSGLRVENVGLGMRLPPVLVPCLEALAQLERDRPEQLGLVSEIRLAPRGDGEIELVLYSLTSPVPARIGNCLDGETLSRAVLTWEVLKRRGLEGEAVEVDLRNGLVSYARKRGD